MSVITSLVILAWVAIVLLALAVGGLTAQLRTLHMQNSSNVSRTRVTPVGSLLTPNGPLNGPYIALFTQSSCPGCDAMLPTIAAEFGTSGQEVPIVVVSDSPGELSLPHNSNIQWIVDPEAATRFGIPAFPLLLAVNIHGDILDDGVVPNPSNAVTRIYANAAKGEST